MRFLLKHFLNLSYPQAHYQKQELNVNDNASESDVILLIISPDDIFSYAYAGILNAFEYVSYPIFLVNLLSNLTSPFSDK